MIIITIKAYESYCDGDVTVELTIKAELVNGFRIYEHI